MSADDLFEPWKRQRARADVPPGFADRVLSRLPPRPSGAGTWLRVAACVLAACAGLFRMASVLGLFLPS
jgi:hypothetical protein